MSQAGVPPADARLKRGKCSSGKVSRTERFFSGTRKWDGKLPEGGSGMLT